MNLTAQYETTRQALLRAKPRSTRRIKLQSELVRIQVRRIRQELKRGKK